MSRIMDNLDLLSDDELRLRLMEYGFPNLPVTDSTRKILIKKLRNHMENEKGRLRKQTSLATRYSSGEEESDGERKLTRRSVTANAPSTRTTMPPPAVNPISKQRTSKRSAISSSKLLANNNNNYYTPSGSLRSAVYISPVIINDSEEEDYSTGIKKRSGVFGNTPPFPSTLVRRTTTSTLTPPARQSTTPPSSPQISATDYRFTRNHTPPGSTGSLNDSSNSNGSASDSPFVSEYTKRLLQLRGETVSHENYNSTIGNAIANPSTTGTFGRNSSLSLNHSGAPISGNHFRSRYSYSGRYSGHHDAGGGGGGGVASTTFNENDIVTHAQPSPEPPQIPLRIALGNLITKLDDHYGFKQTVIPCTLLCMFIAFLVFVAFMYMTISTDIASTLSSIDTRYDICQDVGSNKDRCVTESTVEPALELLKLVGPELKSKVEQSKCVDSDVTYWMSADEVLKFAKENNPNLLIPQLHRYLHSMEYLIDRNPQWRINHCDESGNEISFDEVLRRRPTKSNYFAILKPKLPFTCMLYNKFYKFFVIVGVLGIIGLTTYLVNYFLKFVLYVKQKRKDQVNTLISDIIQTVSQATSSPVASDSPTPETGAIVVNHLRDRLISPENRKKLEWAWMEALQFLHHNESRIQFEVANLGGEDFKVMRWVDSAPPGANSANIIRHGSGSIKKWQSPAFDNTNKIPDPPTPCLKIRQMFDKYEVNDPNLKTIVQDAILEKVGSRCKIYDIQLDRSTCCVYVRCASAKDAGIVHDEINGWWFDNRLVSIKFLRLERYLARFPRSSAGPICLKPSNRNNSSMSQQQQQQQQRPVGDRPANLLERDDDEEDEEEEDELELEQEQEC